MTTNLPVDPPAKSQAGSAPETDFAWQMHALWEKNRSFILLLGAIALLALIGREGWGYFTTQREQAIRLDYDTAVASPEKLAAFAAEYPTHALAGVAWLELADAEYTAGDFKTAASNYQQAAGSLAEPALKSRARLGSAMSLLAGGDLASGEAALKPLVDDATADKVVRAEACYHLATLASEAGRTDEVRNLTDEITKIDPMSVWAQRAFALRASLVTEAKPAPAPSALSLPQIK
jgi:predicted negative regulator of RcsB-dependent stress response